VADCLAAYLRRGDREDLKLISYAERLGNGAVFKRLGFLAERQATGAALAELCLSHLSAGHAKLDPAMVNQRLCSKWRLRVPQTWMPEER
jgi:predicted transcriptional regulator of viral defense system